MAPQFILLKITLLQVILHLINGVMTKEVKVSFYLKRNETKKDGKSPVMARLSIGKFSETIFSAKMTVPADLWASGRATGKSHTSNEINRQLDEIRASCSTTIYTIYKETGSAKWTFVASILPLILGFVVCFITTQIWNLF